jgi:DNA-binding PadR family transcriptional regulator
MDRIDKKILLGLLGTQQSMYSLEKSLTGTNYATVYRHIRKMQKEGLVIGVSGERKNGSKDARNTTSPKLTSKGKATLIIEGELEKTELIEALKRQLAKNYSDLSASFVSGSHVDEVYINLFEKVKHKINLKYFDETYFNQILNISFIESIFETIKNHSIGKNVNAHSKAKAREEGIKHVSGLQIEMLKTMREGFKIEQERYTHYVKFIDELIEVAKKMMEEKKHGSRF